MKIHIPTPLRAYADKQTAVHVGGNTVGEALGQLVQQYHELRHHLFNDEGALRAFVNVYVNDEDIRYLQKEHTPVTENDVLYIVPSVAGGRGED